MVVDIVLKMKWGRISKPSCLILHPVGEIISDEGARWREEFWVAFWDAISCAEKNGYWEPSFLVPVLQSTSCCFDGEDCKLMLVSSTYDGMSNYQPWVYQTLKQIHFVAMSFRDEEVARYQY